MTNALWEVLKDLWRFAFGTEKNQEKYVIPGRPPELDVIESRDLSQSTFTPPLDARSYGRLAYVSVDEAVCFAEPKQNLDTKISTLYYGEEVAVIELRNDFARIQSDDGKGWILTAELSDDRKNVFPIFSPGYVYNDKHQETKKMRRLFRYEASAKEQQLPLQPLELVLLKLKEAGVRLDWPLQKQREPGAWQGLLRGTAGVTIDLHPRTSAVLQCVGNGTPGFLGYVESVAPDQTITVASAGRVEPGEYRVEKFKASEWKQWQPTFISFTQ